MRNAPPLFVLGGVDLLDPLAELHDVIPERFQQHVERFAVGLLESARLFAQNVIGEVLELGPKSFLHFFTLGTCLGHSLFGRLQTGLRQRTPLDQGADFDFGGSGFLFGHPARLLGQAASFVRSARSSDKRALSRRRESKSKPSTTQTTPSDNKTTTIPVFMTDGEKEK